MPNLLVKLALLLLGVSNVALDTLELQYGILVILRHAGVGLDKSCVLALEIISLRLDLRNDERKR